MTLGCPVLLLTSCHIGGALVFIVRYFAFINGQRLLVNYKVEWGKSPALCAFPCAHLQAWSWTCLIHSFQAGCSYWHTCLCVYLVSFPHSQSLLSSKCHKTTTLLRETSGSIQQVVNFPCENQPRQQQHTKEVQGMSPSTAISHIDLAGGQSPVSSHLLASPRKKRRSLQSSSATGAERDSWGQRNLPAKVQQMRSVKQCEIFWDGGRYFRLGKHWDYL